ncbi:MAG: hypothetical protein IJ872_05195 [Eubacterium sp.]|nr:hypothetical protein [Eubacterium sp.]
MKKVLCIILCLITVFSLSGCSNTGENRIKDVKIDYGESELFSQKDREAGVELILAEIKTWKGVKTLHNVRYAGDSDSLEEKWYDEHEEVMVFYSDFKTVKSSSKAGGFNPDAEYTDWNWIVGKNDDGQWELLTWGY